MYPQKTIYKNVLRVFANHRLNLIFTHTKKIQDSPCILKMQGEFLAPEF